MVNKHTTFARTLMLVNEAASDAFANVCASCLPQAGVLTFSGQIGAGKTTLIRAMLKQLGVQSAIKSPTFSLVETYVCHTLLVHHFDLYRIQEEDELEYIGFRDYFMQDCICFIEWPEHAGRLLPKVDLQLNLRIEGEGRALELVALTACGSRILSCLAGGAC